MDAWAKWTNAHGGINGHQVEVITMDDNGSPSTGLAAASKLINGEHVSAIVGSETDQLSWGPSVMKQGVPILGTMGGVAIALNNPENQDFYPTGTSIGFAGTLSLSPVKEQGLQKVGLLICNFGQVCNTAEEISKKSTKDAGLTFVKGIQVASAAPSYVAECLAMKQSGAQAVNLGVEPEVSKSVADTCAQQGYHPMYVGTAAVVTEDWATDPAFDGAVGELDEFPWWDTSVPAIADFNAAMKQYDPAALKKPTVAAEVWAAAMVFAEGAKHAKVSGDLTPAALTAGLNSISNDTIGGLTPPLTFTNKNRDVKCAVLFQVKNGKFGVLNDGKAKCAQ